MKRGFFALAIAGILAAGSTQTLLAAEDGGGCGIGKVIMEGKTGQGANIVAAILNQVLIPNTFFMSTAATIGKPVLGCDPNATVQRETERNFFVASNLDQLSQEMAQGAGGHLEALADSLGISASDKPEFYRMTQDEYVALASASDAGATEVITSLRVAMAERPTLARYVQ